MGEVVAPVASGQHRTAVPDRSDELERAMRSSLAAQLGARALHLLLNIGTSLAIVRYLGPRGYGDYVVVVTTTGLTALAADAGLHKLAVREVARRPDEAEAVIGTTVAIRLVLAIGAAGLAQLILIPLGASGTVRVAALVASLMAVTEALLGAVVVFHVTLRQSYEALVRTTMEIVEVAVLVLVIRAGGSIVGLVAAPVAGGVLGAALAHSLGWYRFGVRLRFDRMMVRPLLRGALPLGPALVIGVLVLKVDGVLVAALRPREDAGIYGAAFQPIEYAFLATTVVAFPFLPVLSRWFREDRAHFTAMYQRGTELLLALLAPVPVFALVAGADLVDAAYRPAWSPAVTPMRILAVALLPMALTAWQSMVLLAGDREGAVLPCMVLALAISTTLCLLLVPRFGPSGAAVAALAANVVAARWALRRTVTLIGVGLRWTGPAQVMAAAAGAGAVFAGSHLLVAWPAAVLVALVVYGAVLLKGGMLDLGFLAGAEARTKPAVL
jgi:O-antigen/teichoic acid export membrane protein